MNGGPGAAVAGAFSGWQRPPGCAIIASAPDRDARCVETRRLDGAAGPDWLGRGWRIFAASPGTWIAMAVVLVLVFAALSLVPVVGSLAAQVIAPALGGVCCWPRGRSSRAGRPTSASCSRRSRATGAGVMS